MPEPTAETRRAATIIGMLLWMFLMPLVPLLADGHLSYFALHAIGLAFVLGVYAVARPSARTLKLTWAGTRRSLKRSAVVTALLAAISVAARYGCDRAGLTAPGTPFFTLSMPAVMALYIVVAAPLQEIGFRGLFQGVVRETVGRGRAASVTAVVASTIGFGALHFAWGWSTAVGSLIPGLAWGVLAETDETLVGVVVSHGVAGWFFFTSLSMTQVLYPRH